MFGQADKGGGTFLDHNKCSFCSTLLVTRNASRRHLFPPRDTHASLATENIVSMWSHTRGLFRRVKPKLVTFDACNDTSAFIMHKIPPMVFARLCNKHYSRPIYPTRMIVTALFHIPLDDRRTLCADIKGLTSIHKLAITAAQHLQGPL